MCESAPFMRPRASAFKPPRVRDLLRLLVEAMNLIAKPHSVPPSPPAGSTAL